MSTTTTSPASPPRRPPSGQPAAPSSPSRQTVPKFSTSRGITRKANKTGVYGPEGIGKSHLASLCPGIVFADLEYSTLDMDVVRVDGIVGDNGAQTWSNLRAWVQSINGDGVYCIDSMTRAEDLCAEFVIKNKKSNEGMSAADSLEDFKYKAGLTFVVDEFRRFLGDIEAAFLRGASFVMIAHNRVNRFKSPDGSDFIRHEPRLLDDPKGSNMTQWIQFLDHLLFIDLDKNVDKGKAKGGGSRTIYLDTAPSRLSKTRSLPTDPMPFEKDSTELWNLLKSKS